MVATDPRGPRTLLDRLPSHKSVVFARYLPLIGSHGSGRISLPRVYAHFSAHESIIFFVQLVSRSIGETFRRLEHPADIFPSFSLCRVSRAARISHGTAGLRFSRFVKRISELKAKSNNSDVAVPLWEKRKWKLTMKREIRRNTAGEYFIDESEPATGYISRYTV